MADASGRERERDIYIYTYTYTYIYTCIHTYIVWGIVFGCSYSFGLQQPRGVYTYIFSEFVVPAQHKALQPAPLFHRRRSL